VPFHGYLPVLAGKKTFAHVGTMADLFVASDGPLRTKLINDLRQAFREKRYGAIVADPGWFEKDIEQYYTIKALPGGAKTFVLPFPGGGESVNVIYILKRSDR
jgi:hypothetical protein